MNIGIVGTRRRNSNRDLEIVSKAFADLVVRMRLIDMVGPNVTIVSGHCPSGADRFAEIIARDTCYPIILHKPDWGKFGRSAGFKRNTLIARDSDILIACVATDRRGGTEDTIIKFKKFHPDGEVILV